MSYKPEVQIDGKWESNGLVFATETEAAHYASDLFRRWTLCQGHRAVESDLPVTHQIIDSVMTRVPEDAHESASQS